MAYKSPANSLTATEKKLRSDSIDFFLWIKNVIVSDADRIFAIFSYIFAYNSWSTRYF